MKIYNFSLMPLLALTDCKIVDKYFVSIFLEDKEDLTKYKISKRLYVLLESNGTKDFVKYFENIILNSETLIRYYHPEIGYIMCVFEISNSYYNDYENIKQGNYKNLSKDFKQKVTNYFDDWENIIDTRYTSFFDVKELVINIANNSNTLIADYWENNCDDIEWLKTIMETNGNYWSAPLESNCYFTIEHLEKWKE